MLSVPVTLAPMLTHPAKLVINFGLSLHLHSYFHTHIYLQAVKAVAIRHIFTDSPEPILLADG